jgi:hypothetical protein
MAILKVRPSHEVLVDDDLYDYLSVFNWKIDSQSRVIAWCPVTGRTISLIKTVWQNKMDRPYSKKVQRLDKDKLDYTVANLIDVKTIVVSNKNRVATLSCNGISFQVDTKFYKIVTQHNWRNDGKGYLRASYYGDPEREDSYVSLHQFIYFLEYGEVISGYGAGTVQIDHIDRDPLNNCISNLRVVDYSENNLNRNLAVGVVGYKYLHEFKRQGSRYNYVVKLPRVVEGQRTKVFEKIEEALTWRDSKLLSISRESLIKPVTP